MTDRFEPSTEDCRDLREVSGHGLTEARRNLRRGNIELSLIAVAMEAQNVVGYAGDVLRELIEIVRAMNREDG